MVVPEMMEFELSAEKLLQGGGIKNKSVKVIQETSKLISERIDSKLESVIMNSKINPDFFISSKIMRDIWISKIINYNDDNDRFQPRVGLDLIKTAFQTHLEGVDTSEGFELLKSYLPTYTYSLSDY